MNVSDNEFASVKSCLLALPSVYEIRNNPVASRVWDLWTVLMWEVSSFSEMRVQWNYNDR